MTAPTRWRPVGHTVLDDKTGASLDCMAPSVVKSELRDSWSTALAHSVAAKLNDTDRPRRDWTRARRAAGHAAWVSCVAVVALAMVVPQLAAALSLLGLGAIVGTMVTSACSRSWRRNAEAKAARTDAATEHALRVAVDAQRTEDEVAVLRTMVSGETPAVPDLGILAPAIEPPRDGKQVEHPRPAIPADTHMGDDLDPPDFVTCKGRCTDHLVDASCPVHGVPAWRNKAGQP